MWMNSEINPPLWDEEGQGELSVTRPSRVWTSDWTPPLPVRRASCADASHWTPAPSLTFSANKLDCLPCLLLSTHFYFLIYLFFNVPSWPRVCEQGEKTVSVQPANQIWLSRCFSPFVVVDFFVIIQCLEIYSVCLRKKSSNGSCGIPPTPSLPAPTALMPPSLSRQWQVCVCAHTLVCSSHRNNEPRRR